MESGVLGVPGLFAIFDRTAFQARLAIDTTGRVGIGTITPTSKLSVAGLVESTNGGFKFPDGTIQTTAATGGSGGGGEILNQTTLQTSANFNIDGTGSSGIFNATTQYNIGGNRVLGVAPKNLFVGIGAGAANTTATTVSFVGYQAGAANTTGGNNTFVGFLAGSANSTGLANAYFGSSAGSGSTGSFNSYFGDGAGDNDSTGFDNSMFGQGSAGPASGHDNSYFGYKAGGSAVSNSTAIGARTQVTQDNSMVLGSINGVNGATADTSVGIGTTAPKAKLQVQGGNIYVGAPGQGIILKSPDGSTCRLMTIDNAGAMVLSAVACP